MHGCTHPRAVLSRNMLLPASPRSNSVAVFGDGSGQLLQWEFSSSAKLTLVTSLGSKVFALAAAQVEEQQQVRQSRMQQLRQQLQHLVDPCLHDLCDCRQDVTDSAAAAGAVLSIGSSNGRLVALAGLCAPAAAAAAVPVMRRRQWQQQQTTT